MGVEALAIVVGFSDKIDEVAYQELSSAGIPFCFVARWVEGVAAPRVAVNCRKAGYEGTRHLLEQGHERIAFFGHAAWSDNSANMQGGYAEALAEAGLQPWPEEPSISSSLEATDLYRSARALLSVSPRPTAVFCTFDPLAYQLVRAADDVGLKIPEQLSVMGFGRICAGEPDEPRFLAGMEVPKEEMGKEAGKMLLRMMMGASVQSEVVVDPFLSLGRTTGPAPQE
jgi:LacI family transcriptional regulator